MVHFSNIDFSLLRPNDTFHLSCSSLVLTTRPARSPSSSRSPSSPLSPYIAGISALVSVLPQHPTLSVLTLNNTSISDVSLQALVKALLASAKQSGKSHCMPDIWLNQNNIGDDGAVALATLIAKNRTSKLTCFNSYGDAQQMWFFVACVE